MAWHGMAWPRIAKGVVSVPYPYDHLIVLYGMPTATAMFRLQIACSMHGRALGSKSGRRPTAQPKKTPEICESWMNPRRGLLWP
jgi:hypothetical protein